MHGVTFISNSFCFNNRGKNIKVYSDISDITIIVDKSRSDANVELDARVIARDTSELTNDEIFNIVENDKVVKITNYYTSSARVVKSRITIRIPSMTYIPSLYVKTKLGNIISSGTFQAEKMTFITENGDIVLDSYARCVTLKTGIGNVFVHHNFIKSNINVGLGDVEITFYAATDCESDIYVAHGNVLFNLGRCDFDVNYKNKHKGYEKKVSTNKNDSLMIKMSGNIEIREGDLFISDKKVDTGKI